MTGKPGVPRERRSSSTVLNATSREPCASRGRAASLLRLRDSPSALRHPPQVVPSATKLREHYEDSDVEFQSSENARTVCQHAASATDARGLSARSHDLISSIWAAFL